MSAGCLRPLLGPTLSVIPIEVRTFSSTDLSSPSISPSSHVCGHYVAVCALLVFSTCLRFICVSTICLCLSTQSAFCLRLSALCLRSDSALSTSLCVSVSAVSALCPWPVCGPAACVFRGCLPPSQLRWDGTAVGTVPTQCRPARLSARRARYVVGTASHAHCARWLVRCLTRLWRLNDRTAYTVVTGITAMTAGLLLLS